MVVFERHADKLRSVEEKLDQALKTGDRYINGSLDYLTSTKGKMLRPLLYFIGAQIAQAEADMDIATGIEMLHVATLIHDDIVDESKMRRGRESIQSKYSKDYALYMGDYLLSSLFLLLSNAQLERQELLSLARLMQRICIAEMQQYHQRYNLDMTFRQYVQIISGKTAALFSLSLSAAAKGNGMHKHLARIGYHLGIAFQIQDDLLDYEGDSSRVGKDLRKDLWIGNYNLPIIFARAAMPEETEELFSTEPWQEPLLDELLQKSGALQKTKRILQNYYDKIERDLNHIPKESQQDLCELIQFLRGRKH